MALLTDLYTKAKKRLFDIGGSVSAATRYRPDTSAIAQSVKSVMEKPMTMIEPVRSFVENPKPTVTKVLNTKVDIPKPVQPMYNFLSKNDPLEYAKKVPRLTALSDRTKNPIAKTGAAVLEGVVNAPSDTIRAFGNAGQKLRDNAEGRLDALGAVGELGVNMAGIYAGGGAAKTAATAGVRAAGSGAVRVGVRKAAQEAATTGAKVGAGYGAALGASQGLQGEGGAMERVVRAGKEAVSQGAIGSVAGGILGGATAGGSAVAKSVKEDIATMMKPRPTKRIVLAGENPVIPKRGKVEETIAEHFAPRTKRVYDATQTLPEGVRAVPGEPKTTWGRVHATGEDIPGVVAAEMVPKQTAVRVPAAREFRTPSTLRGIADSLPRPGMSIEDVSPKIREKNAKARELVRREMENRQTRSPQSEPGFVAPEAIQAPKRVELPSIKDVPTETPEPSKLDDFSKALDSIPTPWEKKPLTKTEQGLLDTAVREGSRPLRPGERNLDMEAEAADVERSISKNMNPVPGTAPKFDQKAFEKAWTPQIPNKYQKAALAEKKARQTEISRVKSIPRELSAMGFTKREASRLGVDEAQRIAKLGRLGYLRQDIASMDLPRQELILRRGVPKESLDQYYAKKRTLDTNLLDGIDPSKLEDISAMQAGTRDVYRNFETVFGGGKYDDPTFQKVKQGLLDPFDESKGAFIEEQKQMLSDLEENIVKKLGIRKGSDLSSAVQKYGEKKLSLDDLKKQFPKDWKKVVEADRWFRNAYDTMLDETNRIREFYFPTHPLYPESTKQIPKRENYYRHFKEMTDGFAGLKNIFDTPANIDPSLAVSSQYTKPLTTFLPFAQKRKGDETTMDAVGGFLDYIKANAYARHIDPHIQRFRGVDAELKSKTPKGAYFDDTRVGIAEELSKKLDQMQQIADTKDAWKIKNMLIEKGIQDRDAVKMAKDLSGMSDAADVEAYMKANLSEEGMAQFAPKALAEDSGNKLNHFLKFLDNFAADLAGKTNPLDRPVQDNMIGRQAFKAINWLNSRVKANVILGNVGSALAQPFSIPSGIANAGVKNSIPAVGDSLLGILKDDMPISRSNFIRERFFNGYDRFDTGVINNAKRAAVWMTSIGDKVGSTFVWNAQYRRALAEGAADPVKWADDWTRRIVAGRGVGEVPILQKSRVTQLVAPFQLEVANQWRVFADWAKNDPSKLAVARRLMEYSVATWMMNRVVKSLRGSDVAFDPMQAMIDAYQTYNEEENKGIGALKAGGRIAGEVFSNLPGGSVPASWYPEYGTTVAGKELPTREDVFGDKDPTRFGNGLLASKALIEPQYYLAPKFGGRQIKTTLDGMKTLRDEAAKTTDGRIMTPVERTPENMVRGLLFGKGGTSEVQNYRENDMMPLSADQTEKYSIAGRGYFDQVMNERAANKEKEALKNGVVSTANATTGDIPEGISQLKNGTFYVPSLLSDTKTFRKLDDAKMAIEMEDFEASGENFRDLGDYVLRKSSDGTPSKMRKDAFSSNLYEARMTNAKKNKDVDTWIAEADKQYKVLTKMIADPSIDELDKVTIQNKLDTLIAEYAKVDSYGGFTKPKKLPENLKYPMFDKTMFQLELENRRPSRLSSTSRMTTFRPARIKKVRKLRRK